MPKIYGNQKTLHMQKFLNFTRKIEDTITKICKMDTASKLWGQIFYKSRLEFLYFELCLFWNVCSDQLKKYNKWEEKKDHSSCSQKFTFHQIFFQENQKT